MQIAAAKRSATHHASDGPSATVVAEQTEETQIPRAQVAMGKYGLKDDLSRQASPKRWV